MDFALSEEQEALREGVARFCAGRIGVETLRRLEGTGFDRALWSALAELGVFGMRADDAGGSGLADAVLVFEALGRALAPGPILWSHLAAGLVPGAAAGEVVVTGVEIAADGSGPFVLEHLDVADVVVALREDGIERLDARAILAEAGAGAERAARPLDPLTPVHRLATLPRGEPIGDAEHAERLRLEGATLSAALLLGIAEETLALATRHAGERHQFDRPIGSFQAIKHLLADAFARQALARATVYAAGVLLDAPGTHPPDAPDASPPHASTATPARRVMPTASAQIQAARPDDAARRAVAAAKLIAGDAALTNARTCIQVHGGMGFTWESPVHYALKRAWVLENGFGTSRHQAEALAAAIAASA
ncbi:MAG: acyl-CoA dehydrogenase family protein [Myxococcota bacterium]